MCLILLLPFILAAGLRNLLAVTAARQCPFLSQLRSKTTSEWNRTCSLPACMAPPGMFSPSATPASLSFYLLFSYVFVWLCLLSCRIKLCCAGNSKENSPQCGGCRASGPGFLLNSPGLLTGGAQPHQSSPLGEHLNQLLFLLVFVKGSVYPKMKILSLSTHAN